MSTSCFNFFLKELGSLSSDSLAYSRKSKRCQNLYSSQEFEKIDSDNTSFDVGHIKSVNFQHPESKK